MIEKIISHKITEAIASLYQGAIEAGNVNIQKTRKEIAGDFTVVVFPFLRMSKKSPEITAQEIGQWMTDNVEQISGFNVIKGFLNLEISNSYWIDVFNTHYNTPQFGYHTPASTQNPTVIEYSSPNTNKPLHLGHIRNNLLGFSVAKILEASGQPVVKVNLVNDRGIHICKSMLAWIRFGNGETPQSTGIKGDKLVGNYYVRFDKEYKKEVAQLIEQGIDKEAAEKEAPLLKAAQEMLYKWEQGDEEIRQLWSTMNNWVYKGFDVTYNRMGVAFDKIYYESDTYLLGKDKVVKGLENNILFTKENGSVWCDLAADGLDEKLLLRSDGTSVYMTQDLGTAFLRYEDYKPQKMVYVVGNEQNYHFDVLKIILKRLGASWSQCIHHLSYGMVELPNGKMKSREGTVVDADDLMDGMLATARKMTEELGKISDFDSPEALELYRKVSQAALKYFILKVDPKKNMLFNPEESIDFNGNTGPFIQYSFTRIQSVLRKAEKQGIDYKIPTSDQHPMNIKEKSLIKVLTDFPNVITSAADAMSPAMIANYCYDLAREFNQFYHEHSILNADEMQDILFRLKLAQFTGNVIKNGMALLGIEMPERM